MADEADDAYEMEALNFRVALSNLPTGPKLVPVGLCYFCEAPLTLANALFCDQDCAKDWDRVQKLKKIAGRA